ncbi:MAG: glycosyltransferase family 2 protein [Ilumatobacteraceae bacterium]
MTEGSAPAISVVIPTFNRLPRLKQVLGALSKQSLDNSLFEVVVVSDGSTDGTHEYLSGATPRPVVYAHQDNAGPGAARNRGVHLARGRLILFIDDDIVATPTLVERHLQAHGESATTVVIGPMSNAPGFKYSPWVAWEQAMLYKQYRAMRKGVYAPTFRQFYTGNASVARELFLQAGGFDTSFRRAEDIEFAYRLGQLGAAFVFDETAIAHHFAERSFASWLAAAAAYGRNDVTFARDHEQRWLLPAMASEFKQRSVITRFLVRACLTRPRLLPISSRMLQAIGRTPRLIPRVSFFALSGLYALTYYSGAADEYGDRAAFRAMLSADR